MHKPYFGHLNLFGQDTPSDKTKHINMYVVILQHDGFHIWLKMPADTRGCKQNQLYLFPLVDVSVLN